MFHSVMALSLLRPAVEDYNFSVSCLSEAQVFEDLVPNLWYSIGKLKKLRDADFPEWRGLLWATRS